MITKHDPSRDFDFFIGTWRVFHRRLTARLQGADTWQTFESICTVRPILGGAGNMDDMMLDTPSGPYYGMTVRLYNPVSQQWRLNWADSLSGAFFPPMIGGFASGEGRFYAHEPNEGVMVYSRFVWSHITANSCHWAQALSADGGQTWETNWTMEHVRLT